MRYRRLGLTLVELMMVVAIVGILALVAIPGYSRYRLRARTAEVPEKLAALFVGANSYFQTPRTVALGGGITMIDHCIAENSARIPATPGKEPQQANFLADPTFVAFNFSSAQGVYYGYSVLGNDGCSVTSTPEAYTFVAEGDLDGDSLLSRFELAVGARGSGELYRAGGLHVVAEHE